MGIMEASKARENLYKNVYCENCVSKMCSNIAKEIGSFDYSYNMAGLSMTFNVEKRIGIPYGIIDSEIRRILSDNDIQCDEPGLLYNVTSILCGTEGRFSIILYL